MKKTYIAPVISDKYSFVDDLMVTIPSGGPASGNGVTDAEVKEWGEFEEEEKENQYSLW